MPKMTESEVRFELLRGVQLLSKTLLRDLVSKSPEVRERAVVLAVDTLAVRFAGMEVIAPEPKRMDFGDMKNG